MPTITQIIADAYRKMVNPPAPTSVARPKWVPASITEENVTLFVQAVTEARKANESIVEFHGKKYGINKAVKEDANVEDDNKSKKIQDMDAENAPKQDSDEVPAEVKEEDSEEIKVDNHDDKQKDAEEMQKIAASEAPGDKRAEMAEELVGNQKKIDVNKNGKIDGDDLKKLRSEELVGNQHKLDVNKNGKVDGDDLKKLRGEEKEEDSDEKDADHAEPDADDMGGPSDHDADNEDEDEKEEDEKPKMTGEQTIASLAATYASMVNENDEYVGDNPVDKLHFDVPAFIRTLERAREEFKTDEDIHNFTQELLAMKSDCIHTADLPTASMKEETENDEDDEDEKDSEKGPDSAEAGPEVMDPATQKMKDAHNKNVEVKDGVPGSAQDGADNLNPADKPAPANKSEALPKISVITAPVTTNENTENMNSNTIKSVGEAYIRLNEREGLTDSEWAISNAAHSASDLTKHHNSAAAHTHAAELHDSASREIGVASVSDRHDKKAEYHEKMAAKLTAKV